jgi:hypothetical protein
VGRNVLIFSLVIAGAAGGFITYETVKPGNTKNQTQANKPDSPSGNETQLSTASGSAQSAESENKGKKTGLVQTVEPTQPAVELEKPSKVELKKKLKDTDLAKRQKQHILDMSEKAGGGLSTSKLKKIIDSMEDKKLRDRIRDYQNKVYSKERSE